MGVVEQKEELINLADKLYEQMQALDKEHIKECVPILTLHSVLKVIFEHDTEEISEWIQSDGKYDLIARMD